MKVKEIKGELERLLAELGEYGDEDCCHIEFEDVYGVCYDGMFYDMTVARDKFGDVVIYNF